MRSRVVAFGTFSLALASFAVMTVWHVHTDVQAAASLPMDPPAGELEQSEVYRLLGELGLSPETAVVAGLTASEANQVLTALTSRGTEVSEWLAATGQLAEARESLGHATAQARSQPSNDEARQALSAAIAAMASADARHVTSQNALQGLVDEVLDRTAAVQLQRAARAMAGGLPAEFALVEFSRETLGRTLVALKAEKRCARLGQSLDSECDQLLDSIRTSPTVVEAQQRLVGQLGAMRSVFSAIDVQ